MFEAVSNSLHAIDDRFAESARDKGWIEIEVLRRDPVETASQVVGFVVSDNGIGLNEDNYKSFLRPDSRYKIDCGGKGVGRLDWLKVFNEIKVDSTYDAGEPGAPKLEVGAFDFVLTEEEQVILRTSATAPITPGTRVSLNNFESIYGTRCPVEPETIHKRIIGHFVQVLAADIAPEIVVSDCGSLTDLRATFKELVRDTREENITIKVDNDEEELVLTMRHIRADRAIRPDKNQKNYNWLFMSAHQRVVDDAPIDEAIGLKALADEEVYVGCVYGDYLDRHVNAERTAFTFNADENRAIRRALIDSAMAYLGSHVANMKERKRKVALKVIEEYPQFLYLHGEMQSFVDKLAPGATGKEQVFVEMCRDRFRKTSAAHKVEATLKAAPAYTDQVKAQMEQYQQFVQQQQQGVLAEYVLFRRLIIDILDRYIGFQEGSERHHLEEAIHKLIKKKKKCPCASTQPAWKSRITNCGCWTTGSPSSPISRLTRV